MRSWPISASLRGWSERTRARSPCAVRNAKALQHQLSCKLVSTHVCPRRQYAGTAEYAPPEMLRNQGRSFPSDWWAFGVLMYHLVTGKTPFDADDEDEIFDAKSLAELNAEMPLGDALFNYDESTIREDAQPVLQATAEYLQRWTSTRVTIEGHADSRGTNEYNLALGDRRAAAVRDYLANLGVAADRMLGVTRGEEVPQCVEEEEACWQRNRRGHPVFTAK